MWVRLLLLPPVAMLGLGCVTGGDDVPPPEPGCTARIHRIDRLTLPHTLSEAGDLGFDLDGDTTVDNQLGTLSAMLSSYYDDWHPDDAVTARLDDNRLQWLLRVETCEGDPRIAVGLLRGEDRDGNGRPTIVDGGTWAEGTGTTATAGVGLVPIGYLTDGTGQTGVDAWQEALGLSVDVQPGTGGGVVATVGLGLQLDDVALTPVAAFLTARLQRDDSRFAASIDLDHDGIVTVAELRQAPGVQVLLADDLDLAVPCDDGECYDPSGDGHADRLSLGFRVEGHPVELE